MNSKNLHLHILPIISLVFAGLILGMAASLAWQQSAGLASVGSLQNTPASPGQAGDLSSQVQAQVQAQVLSYQVSDTLVTTPAN